MKSTIKKLIAGVHLTETESYKLFKQLAAAPLEQQAAILALFAAKGETVAELLGAQKFLFEQTTLIDCDIDVIDIVGTGGDGIGTFNISTAASLVVASCGVAVAKHGGRSASSQSGSTDILEKLGLSFGTTSAHIINSLKENSYAFLSAPLFNSALKSVGPLRKNLGFPTLFNFLGPLLNPIKPKKQVIGVNRKDLVQTVASVLQQLGSEHAMVVHSEDGLDELSMSAPTTVAELKNGIIQEYQITPKDAGLSVCALNDVLGRTPSENAEIIKGIFANKIKGPKLDIVLLNSAAGLVVADRVKNFREGVEMAKQAIESGKTAALLNKLQSTKHTQRHLISPRQKLSNYLRGHNDE